MARWTQWTHGESRLQRANDSDDFCEPVERDGTAGGSFHPRVVSRAALCGLEGSRSGLPNASSPSCAIVRLLRWRMQSETPRALAIASLLADGADDIDALFSGGGYGPRRCTRSERRPSPRPCETSRRFMCKANFRHFSKRNWRAPRRRIARRNARHAIARAGRSARQHAESHARRCARGFARGRLRRASHASIRHSPFAFRPGRPRGAAAAQHVRRGRVRIPG